jgi:CHAD domain-containing protein
MLEVMRTPVCTDPRLFVCRYLRAQTDEIILADLAYRGSETDAVHRIRVATHRARSVLTAFPHPVGESVHIAAMIVELRWIATELGAARDIEVQQQRIGTRLAGLSPEQLVGPVRERVDTYFSKCRQHSQYRARVALTSNRFMKLVDSVAVLADESAQTPIDIDVVAATIHHLSRKVSNRARAVRHARVGLDRDVAMHKTRKAVKRLRYAIEATRPLDPVRTDNAVAQFISLQNVLGEHQDSVVAQHQLLQLACEAALASESSATYALLYQQEVDIAAELVGQLDAAWGAAKDAADSLYP